MAIRKRSFSPTPADWTRTIIIPWLKENYDCDVIAVAVDVGQGEELEPLQRKGHQDPAREQALH